MNRLECQFTALREFALNGTDHVSNETSPLKGGQP
jgi:hypothetical protein